MGEISQAVRDKLWNSTGGCDPNFGVKVAEDFTYEDIYALTTGFHGKDGLNPDGFNVLHMSNNYSGNTFEDTRGHICFNKQGPVANRKFADWVDDNCEARLGEGSKKKCEALYDVVDFYSEERFWPSTLKWIAEKAAGAFEIFIIFGPMLYIFHKHMQNRENNKRNGKGGDGNGTGAVGGGGSGVGDVAAVVEGAENPAMDLIAGAQGYLASAAVQADLAGMQKARVVETPLGVDVPEGHVVVQLNNRSFYFAPRAAIAVPRVNVGAFVRVNAARLVPLRMVAAPVR